MRKRIVMASLVAGAGLVFTLAAAQTPRAAQGDEQAIRKAAEALATAFNKGDLDGVTALWAPDADYVDENGKTFKGRAAIGTAFKEAIASLKGHRMKNQSISIRFIKPEVAVEDGRMELAAPDGTSATNRFTAIWVKSGDKWLISSARDLPTESVVTPSNGAKLLNDLDWLVGDWTNADPAVNPSPNSPWALDLNSRWALNKQFLVQEFTIKGKNGLDLSVVQWVGWDPISGQLKSWFFDSKGGHGVGLWERNGNTWNIITEGVVTDGRIGGAVNSLKKIDEKTASWQSRDRQLDGHPITDSEIKLIRKQAKP